MNSYKNLKYRNITFICTLLLIFGIFQQSNNERTNAIFDLLYDFIAIITFSFAYLWLRRRILLIGLVFYGLSWNLDLLTNPIIKAENLFLPASGLHTLSTVFNVIGFICLLTGLAEKFQQKYLTKELKFDIKTTLGLLIGLTIIFQLILRLA